MALRLDRIDLHIHTDFSDGDLTIDETIDAAQRKLDIFAITDHYSEFEIMPRRMTKNQIENYLEILGSRDAIKGIEVDILPDGVSLSRDNRDLCDLVLGGVHVLHGIVFWYDPRPIANPRKFVEEIRIMLIQAMESGLLDILVHPTQLPDYIRPETKRLISKDWIRSVIDAASSHKVAIEISGAWKVPDDIFVLECLRQGTKLAIGSDAHNLSMIGDTQYSVDMLKSVKASSEAIFFPRRK